MKSRRAAAALAGVGAVLAISMLAVFVALPAIADSRTVQARVEKVLARWSGGELSFNGPVELSYFPGVALTATGVTLSGGRLPLIEHVDAEHATFSLGLGELLRGKLVITQMLLSRPKIKLREGDAGGTDAQDHPAQMVALLLDMPVEKIRIDQGSVSFRTKAGGQLVTALDADLRLNGMRGSLVSSGAFLWRDQPVQYNFRGGGMTLAHKDLRVPVRLSVSSPELSAQFEGDARMAVGLTLDGRLDVAMDDVRESMRWLGVPMPDGAGLRGLHAAGRMQWSGATIDFEDGAYSVDGNSAVGALAVRLDGARPRLDGTLAFDRMSLAPYIEPIRETMQMGSDPLDLPLSHHFDADVRVSANAIEAGSILIDQVALTVSLNDGVLRSDAAELSVCGGSGNGNLLIDSQKAATKVRFNATLTGVASETCLAGSAVAGASDVKSEIVSEGRNVRELLANASGKINTHIGQGEVELDLAKLAAAVDRGDVQGWSQGGRTAFESLSAECRMRDGLMDCPIFAMKLPSGSVFGKGEINLSAQNIDWTLYVRTDAPSPGSGAPAGDARGLLIRGPLWDPLIKRSYTDVGMRTPAPIRYADRSHAALLGLNLRR